MSDNGHHDPGGHELEAVNTKMLFRLLISLSLITLLAAYAVVQWFYFQRSELEGRYAAEGSFQLKNYKTKMAGQLEGVDAVAKEVAANPALLAGAPPPSGWMHPDDLVGTAPAAKPAAPLEPAVESHAGHKHATPEGQPTEVAKPEGAKPEGEPAEGAKPETDPAEGDKKPEANPAEGEKANDEKANDEKADDKSGQ